jgi:hypothetical protein
VGRTLAVVVADHEMSQIKPVQRQVQADQV